MVNLQDFIENGHFFKKIKVDDLLFVEFDCPMNEEKSSIWWHNNFFTFVVTGETMLQTPQSQYIIKAGDCIFAKKGSVITYNLPHEDFCELMVFVPDHFIKSVIQKYKITLLSKKTKNPIDTIIPLTTDELLTSYFHSLLAYFNLPEPPSGVLLKIKFEELLVQIISNNLHASLQYCFREICANTRPSVREIMESNFTYNLSLDEFARLCARSLSSFKTEFRELYQTTPGRWLLEKRLEYSRYLLETTRKSIEEISYESGFKNNSHFIRVFKNKFRQSPWQYKLQKKSVLQ
jgi:AraC family transcriptional regulator, exoenzyme S synthesis regulatory protein ExsA